MAEFVSKDLGQGTVSTLEYNQYCHFVAGLVGDGLTRLFAATGVEDPEILLSPDLANRYLELLHALPHVQVCRSVLRRICLRIGREIDDTVSFCGTPFQGADACVQMLTNTPEY